MSKAFETVPLLLFPSLLYHFPIQERWESSEHNLARRNRDRRKYRYISVRRIDVHLQLVSRYLGFLRLNTSRTLPEAHHYYHSHQLHWNSFFHFFALIDVFFCQSKGYLPKRMPFSKEHSFQHERTTLTQGQSPDLQIQIQKWK